MNLGFRHNGTATLGRRPPHWKTHVGRKLQRNWRTGERRERERLEGKKREKRKDKWKKKKERSPFIGCVDPVRVGARHNVHPRLPSLVIGVHRPRSNPLNPHTICISLGPIFVIFFIPTPLFYYLHPPSIYFILFSFMHFNFFLHFSFSFRILFLY